MKSNPEKTVTFSKECLKKMENLCAAEGLVNVPPFLRWITTHKDSTIKFAMIEEAFADITTDDIAEQKSLDEANDALDGPRPFLELLYEIILRKIKQQMRSVSESLKLSTSLERGKKYHEVPERDDLADLVMQWHLNEERTKKVRAQLKDTLGNFSGTIKEILPSVENYFTRSNTTSQKIVLQNRQFRLVKKTSTTRSRVGITVLGPWILSALQSVKTLDNLRHFQKNSSTVLSSIQNQLDTTPTTTKSVVSLCSLKDPSKVEPEES